MYGEKTYLFSNLEINNTQNDKATTQTYDFSPKMVKSEYVAKMVKTY